MLPCIYRIWTSSWVVTFHVYTSLLIASALLLVTHRFPAGAIFIQCGLCSPYHQQPRSLITGVARRFAFQSTPGCKTLPWLGITGLNIIPFWAWFCHPSCPLLPWLNKLDDIFLCRNCLNLGPQRQSPGPDGPEPPSLCMRLMSLFIFSKSPLLQAGRYKTFIM